MKFEEALPFLKEGKRIIRKSLEEDYEYMWLSYEYCEYTNKKEITFMNEPWKPSAEQLKEDLLADDWKIVEEVDIYAEKENDRK